MGLHKQYLKYGQTAKEQLFNISNATGCGGTGGGKSRHNGLSPFAMLISQGLKLNHNRLAVIIIGIATLILGIILSSIPWLDYFILKNLRLWNNSLSFHYWQRPGVIRLTKVYIFNVTNPDGFLNGEKPKLEEVGPFVYREDMEKVNIKFYDNYTVSYQHKKILQFVPEMSIDKNTKIITPNIPLLTLTSQSNNLGYLIAKTISLIVTAARFKPFISLTADQLVFGYDDALVSLAHRFYPRNMRPMSQMGLLIGRNGTLSEVSTINTGHTGMEKFGYMDRLNGLDHMPYWPDKPCNSIAGSEGSFFPPRDITHNDVVYLYDKDLCRLTPLEYRHAVEKDGLTADLYEVPENAYGDSSHNKDNRCFDTSDYDPIKGLQNISPCQYGAPVYTSNPHFFQADPSLLESVEGLKPNKSKHITYFKIQPKVGVPLEGKVRIQLNLKVDQSQYVNAVKDFRDFVFPIMWLEEGISELTPSIRRWIYLGTVFAPTAVPLLTYSMIIAGIIVITFVLITTYQKLFFVRDPTLEIIEAGRKSLRRSSSFIHQHQHKLMMYKEHYTLLKPSASSASTTEETTSLPT